MNFIELTGTNDSEELIIRVSPAKGKTTKEQFVLEAKALVYITHSVLSGGTTLYASMLNKGTDKLYPDALEEKLNQYKKSFDELVLNVRCDR